MILAVVGSVMDGATYNEKKKAFEIVEYQIATLEPTLVISGGARGVDTFAEVAAYILGVPFLKYVPDVQQWNDFKEKIGFKTRNLRIVRECDKLVAVRWKGSKTYGSGWTADRAADMGKTVWRFEV